LAHELGFRLVGDEQALDQRPRHLAGARAVLVLRAQKDQVLVGRARLQVQPDAAIPGIIARLGQRAQRVLLDQLRQPLALVTEGAGGAIIGGGAADLVHVLPLVGVKVQRDDQVRPRGVEDIHALLQLVHLVIPAVAVDIQLFHVVEVIVPVAGHDHPVAAVAQKLGQPQPDLQHDLALVKVHVSIGVEMPRAQVTAAMPGVDAHQHRAGQGPGGIGGCHGR